MTGLPIFGNKERMTRSMGYPDFLHKCIVVRSLYKFGS